jgi:hypothetical protein
VRTKLVECNKSSDFNGLIKGYGTESQKSTFLVPVDKKVIFVSKPYFKAFLGQMAIHSLHLMQSWSSIKPFSRYLVMGIFKGQVFSHNLHEMHKFLSIAINVLSFLAKLKQVPIGQKEHQLRWLKNKPKIIPIMVVTVHISQNTRPMCMRLCGGLEIWIIKTTKNAVRIAKRKIRFLKRAGIFLLGLNMLKTRSKNAPRGQRLPQANLPRFKNKLNRLIEITSGTIKASQ